MKAIVRNIKRILITLDTIEVNGFPQLQIRFIIWTPNSLKLHSTKPTLINSRFLNRIFLYFNIFPSLHTILSRLR